MPLIPSLLAKLSVDHPSILLVASDDFRWSASERTVFYDTTSKDSATLLHEVAHALLDHRGYDKDIQLIEMEQEAWEYARTILAPRYDVTITESVTQDSLDTYRDWLHARSTCPHCQATGLQIKKNRYKCLACTRQWRVNEARLCALRRYSLA